MQFDYVFHRPTLLRQGCLFSSRIPSRDRLLEVMWVVLWGSIVNAIAIVSGSLLGRTLRFPERIRRTIMQALGLAVVLILASLWLESNNILIPIVPLVVGVSLEKEPM